MNMWRVCKVTVLLSFLVLLIACGGGGESLTGNAADPTPGLFEGTTSQGEQIILRAEEVNGQMTVTSIQYTIKMDAQGWSVTSELMQPRPRQIAIEDGRFSGSQKSGDMVEEISGKFVGDEGAEGRLYCTNEHPQGLGTAIGDVTFVVYKKNP